jgi:hypothetical protein
MDKMLFGTTRAQFEEAYKEVAAVLVTDPELLDYVKGYYDHPERFAAFFILSIAGNLRRKGSQPAEVNHASIHFNLVAGSQEMECMIQELFERIANLDKKNKQVDATNCHQMIIRSCTPRDNPDQDPGQSLSKEAFTTIWNPNVDKSKEYDCWVLDTTSAPINNTLSPCWTAQFPCKVLRRGCPDATARYLPLIGKCICVDRLNIPILYLTL